MTEGRVFTLRSRRIFGEWILLRIPTSFASSSSENRRLHARQLIAVCRFFAGNAKLKTRTRNAARRERAFSRGSASRPCPAIEPGANRANVTDPPLRLPL